MIKRRAQELSEQEFVDGYGKPDIDTQDLNKKSKTSTARKFKSHTLPLNQQEYELLCQVADHFGQSHSGALRYALKELAKKVELI